MFFKPKKKKNWNNKDHTRIYYSDLIEKDNEVWVHVGPVALQQMLGKFKEASSGRTIFYI